MTVGVSGFFVLSSVKETNCHIPAGLISKEQWMSQKTGFLQKEDLNSLDNQHAHVNAAKVK